MIIYTDGSAHPNPGKGGYSVIVLDDDEETVLSSYANYYDRTTNNEMELKAILYAMLNYGKVKPTPTLYSDSSYAINTYSLWMFNWAKNGWVKGDKKVPENLEIIKAYYDLYNKGYRLNLKKVKGHNGVHWNEMADKLATGKMEV